LLVWKKKGAEKGKKKGWKNHRLAQDALRSSSRWREPNSENCPMRKEGKRRGVLSHLTRPSMAFTNIQETEEKSKRRPAIKYVKQLKQAINEKVL